MDPRCGIALDSIDPAQWALLEAATDEYIKQEDARIDEACQLLLRGLSVPTRPGLQHLRCGESVCFATHTRVRALVT